jgi:tetratricopeptide (TPR) repeat protein
MSLGSPEQAQELFERAIEVTPSGARRAKALELAAEVMMVSADYAGSIARFEAAIEEYRLVGDHEAVGLATAKLSDPLSFDDRREEAVAMCLRAYNEQGDTGSLNVRAHLAESIAHGHTFGGDFNEVLHWSELCRRRAPRRRRRLRSSPRDSIVGAVQCGSSPRGRHSRSRDGDAL